MKILVLGDVMGPSGIKAIKERLPKLINDKKVDFATRQGSIENKLFIQYANVPKNISSKTLVSFNKTPVKPI